MEVDAEYLFFFILIRRFGLGAVVVGGFVIVALSNFPITFDNGAWYAGYGYAAMSMVAVIALYGFRTSLAGRRVFEFADA